VNWQGFTIELNMYVQHVLATGVVDPAWPAGGRALTDADRQQVHGVIAPDGAGGAVIAWEDGFEVVAQHVLASGTLDPAYPEHGLLLCDNPSGRGDPAIVATGGGGAIVAWTDGRNSGTSPDIFALQVLEAGTTDVPGAAPLEFTFARPSPNPVRASLTLRYALPRQANVRLAIFDIAGRRVRELRSGTEPGGAHAIDWDLRDERGAPVGVGTYFARLEVEQRTLAHQVTRVR
jgi:hypothetical protein